MKYSSQIASLEAMVKSLQAENSKLNLIIKELQSRKPEKEIQYVEVEKIVYKPQPQPIIPEPSP